ncbi:MAG: DNA/RNA non-specific endonuclease [Desulfobacteraceae bacterium]|nr:DNA/RNA non-specific endonuclease [Desulfobacteraceae bacterium]
MRFTRFISILISLTILCSTVFAGETACPEHFADGTAPDFINQKLSAKTREVCYSGYALKHSGITRTPLYSAEHLTRMRLLEGKGLKRQSKFFPDPKIPVSERAELHHYARSGYDRGHVAPSADMFDFRSQQECFSLANMVPQVPENNRGVWEGVESAVRKLTRERGGLYVVTGPIFQGEDLQRIGGAVIVPTQLYKAVYDPDRQEAGAYLVDNAVEAQPLTVSIAELEKLAGINLFPSISEKIKSRAMTLPEPKTYKERRKRGRQHG